MNSLLINTLGGHHQSKAGSSAIVSEPRQCNRGKNSFPADISHLYISFWLLGLHGHGVPQQRLSMPRVFLSSPESFRGEGIATHMALLTAESEWRIRNINRFYIGQKGRTDKMYARKLDVT